MKMKLKLMFMFWMATCNSVGQTNPIELYFPVHLDTLTSDAAPGTFTFYVDPAIGLNVRYKTIFTLVKREVNQTNVDALALNVPIVKTMIVNTNSLQLPADVQELNFYSTYVWQVQTFDEATVVYQSPPAEFTVYDPIESINYFELSNRSNGKILICQNGKAYFSLKANSKAEEYSIVLKKDGNISTGVPIKDEMINEVATDLLVSSRIGVNYYSLDLKAIGNMKGIYTLMLMKENQIAFEVKLKN